MTIYRPFSYLQKQRFLPRQISSPPPTGLNLIIVIPCFAETNLLRTLDSLEAAIPIPQPVEVLIVLNQGVHHGSDITELNQQTKSDFLRWNQSRSLSYHLVEALTLPKKQAGVGLARKIGMDEAVDRFEQAESTDGVIVNLDADAEVSPGYLTMISTLASDSSAQAWSLRFEHPLEGTDFSSDTYEGIVLYELFLRYYIEGLRWAGYPMAFHTIGSSMAVRANAYQAQGGMNRRKAGEDFYFLHKFSQLGKLAEANEAWVIPSPRRSDKVPFGTGRAIGEFLDRGDGTWLIYPPTVFEALRELITQVPSMQEHHFQGSPLIQRFLEEEGLPERIADIRKHSTSSEAFLKRFYAWLDPLKVLKMIHFLRDHQTGEVSLTEAASDLLSMKAETPTKDPVELLQRYRILQSAD